MRSLSSLLLAGAAAALLLAGSVSPAGATSVPPFQRLRSSVASHATALEQADRSAQAAAHAFGHAAAHTAPASAASAAASAAPDASGSAQLQQLQDHFNDIGGKSGRNSYSNNGGAWIGGGGDYTVDFDNDSGTSLLLVVWGPQGSWVNAVQPQVTVNIDAGHTQTISFVSGYSGAWSTVDGGTSLVNGQVSNTWGEFSFSGQYSTVDVSREVNMSGRRMSIQSPNGCTSDMDRCSFQCFPGSNSCWQDYQLVNCQPGSQPGATYGTYGGKPSGGCQTGGNHLKVQLG